MRDEEKTVVHYKRLKNAWALRVEAYVDSRTRIIIQSHGQPIVEGMRPSGGWSQDCVNSLDCKWALEQIKYQDDPKLPLELRFDDKDCQAVAYTYLVSSTSVQDFPGGGAGTGKGR